MFDLNKNSNSVQNNDDLFNKCFRQHNSVDDYFNDPVIGPDLQKNMYFEGSCMVNENLRLTRRVKVTRVKKLDEDVKTIGSQSVKSNNYNRYNDYEPVEVVEPDEIIVPDYYNSYNNYEQKRDNLCIGYNPNKNTANFKEEIKFKEPIYSRRY